MQKKVIVGILGNVMTQNDGRFKDYWKSYVNEDYVTSVLKAGGVPFIIPIVDNGEVMKEQLACVDALIFSGGDADINPKLYHQEMQKESSEPNDRRDFFDFQVMKLAKEVRKPTLCVCRGHQVFNVFHGGSLYQDILYDKNAKDWHSSKGTPDFLAHEISIAKDSLLYDIVQKENISVNSFHHQFVKDVAKELRVVATSPDGVIEALEYKKSDYFCLSLQWHPEMLAAKGDENMLKLFQRLIKEAKNSKENL